MLSERDIEDARSNAHIAGDGRSIENMNAALEWLRGGDHPSQDLLYQDGVLADEL